MSADVVVSIHINSCCSVNSCYGVKLSNDIHHVIIRHLLGDPPPPRPVMTSFMNSPLWQLLGAFGNLWQLMATFGGFWQLMATSGSLCNFCQLLSTLATLGNLWLLLARYGYFGQPLAVYGYWLLVGAVQNIHFYEICICIVYMQPTIWEMNAS